MGKRKFSKVGFSKHTESKIKKSEPEKTKSSKEKEDDSKKLTIAKFAELAIQHCGLITNISESLGVNPSCVYDFIEANPECKKILELCRKKILDIGESNLINRVRGGDMYATTFLLNAIGKERGYGVKSTLEIEGNQEKPLKVDLSKASTDELLVALNAIEKIAGLPRT